MARTVWTITGPLWVRPPDRLYSYETDRRPDPPPGELTRGVVLSGEVSGDRRDVALKNLQEALPGIARKSGFDVAEYSISVSLDEDRD